MIIMMIFWTGDNMLVITVLKKGTNQMPPEVRESLTSEEIIVHEEGSKALISAWFCYILFIWGAKTCLLLFYKRLLDRIGGVTILKITGWVIGITFFGACAAMFLVCQPFRKNWQVVPDPGRM